MTILDKLTELTLKINDIRQTLIVCERYVSRYKMVIPQSEFDRLNKELEKAEKEREYFEGLIIRRAKANT